MDSSGSVDLEQSPPPLDDSPSPPQPRSPLGLFYRRGEQEEPESPLHLVTEEDAGDASASAPEWTSDGYADPSDDEPPTSTASSAGERPAQLLSKAQFRKTGETAVKIGTGMAHTVAARSDEAKHVGLYLADDEDAVNIGHPLADVMYRRGDIVSGKLSQDANDFLRACMGVIGYVTKQVQKVGVIRQLEDARHAQGMTDVGAA